jgi:hypothetical protein
VDDRTFLRAEGPSGLPLERVRPWQCSGWGIAWLTGNKPTATSIIESFDPETLRFRLREPHPMKTGDPFEVIPPSMNWNIHDNTITGCLMPVRLNSYGGETSFFSGNVVTRGGAAGVKQAVDVQGRFTLIGNHISGFDEPGSAALGISPDRFGKPCRSLYRNNIFDGCSSVVTETQKGLWEAADRDGNTVGGETTKGH